MLRPPPPSFIVCAVLVGALTCSWFYGFNFPCLASHLISAQSSFAVWHSLIVSSVAISIARNDKLTRASTLRNKRHLMAQKAAPPRAGSQCRLVVARPLQWSIQFELHGQVLGIPPRISIHLFLPLLHQHDNNNLRCFDTTYRLSG